MTLLQQIQKYGPMSTAAIWDDIVDMRRASPVPDYPASEVDLLATLRALERAGSVRLTEKGWMAVYVTAKVNRVRELFD